jgi:glycerol-3-phosphate acyltransferase PlsY
MTSRNLGLLVGFWDFLKGILSIGAACLAGLDAGQQLLVGLAVIVGHNWPVFLRFHGGRGIATLLGIVVILPILNDIHPWPSVIAVGFVVAVFAVFRTSALPVLIGVALLPLTSWLFRAPNAVALTYFGIFVIVAIKRLTAQKAPVKRQISIWRLLWNRLLFDRDIADRMAWMGHKAARKEPPA